MSLPWLVRSHPYDGRWKSIFTFVVAENVVEKKSLRFTSELISIGRAETFFFLSAIEKKAFVDIELDIFVSRCRKHRSRRNKKQLLHGNYNSIIKKLNSYELRVELSVDSSFASRPWKVFFLPWTNSYRILINSARCWESFAFSKNHLIAETIQFRPWFRIKAALIWIDRYDRLAAILEMAFSIMSIGVALRP